MTKDVVDKILEGHWKQLNNEEDGEYANLSGVCVLYNTDEKIRCELWEEY